MISYDEAQKRIEQAVAAPMAAETCTLPDLLGRILAAPIFASAALPSFDNSAMDGFAMGAVETAGPVRLPVFASIAAGDRPTDHREAGAVEIMTGAPVPPWCETVVPVENVEVERDQNGAPVAINLNGPIQSNFHIRRAGEDVQVGDEILAAGRVLSAEDIMMLAALGVQSAQVRIRPVIALISTGAELIDDAAQDLQPGQIRNSNQPFLAASLQNWPVTSHLMPGHPDDGDAFLAIVEQALQSGAKLILSTGAVSMGARDFVPDALRKIGAEIVFHKCKIRPGKPVLFAILPNGALFFGLPGNPVSAAVGLSFFVLPALRHLLGLGPAPKTMARLGNAYSKRAGFRMFAKAHLQNVDGQNEAQILSGQQSFRIAPLLRANGWAELPEDGAEFEPGEMIRFHPFAGAGP